MNELNFAFSQRPLMPLAIIQVTVVSMVGRLLQIHTVPKGG